MFYPGSIFQKMSITPEVFHFGENVNHPGSIFPGVSNPGFFYPEIFVEVLATSFSTLEVFYKKNDAKPQSEIALEAIENENFRRCAALSSKNLLNKTYRF